MSQDEYFLALAQMFTQGQARAAESSRMVAADLREQARYEDEKPFRDARLNEMLTAGKRAEVGLEAEKFELAQKKELGPIDIKKAQLGYDAAKEQLDALRFENQPEMKAAKLRSTLAKSLGDQARADYEQIQLDELKDPEMKAARKRTTLLQQATAETESRLATGKADEFFASQGQRDQLRNNDVAESNYKIRSFLKPEQLDELNRLKVVSEKLNLIAADQSVKNNDLTRVSSLLDIARKEKLLNGENDELFTQAAQQFISMQSLALNNGATPEAIAKYRQSVSEYLAVNAALSKRGNRVMSDTMSAALDTAMRAAAADMDQQGLSIDQRVKMVAAHFDAASNAAVIALTREQGGAASRPDSRPGDAALGGMLTGGDAIDKPTPQAPKPKNALESMMADEAAAKRKKEFDALQSELAGNEETRAKWTRSAEAVWNEMSPSERKAMAAYFDVGQAAPQNQNDVIRLMGGQLQALSQGDEAALRRGGAGAAKELLLKRVKASR